MSYTNLSNFYRTEFEFKEYRNGGVWSLDEIHNMYPFEREINIMMMTQKVKDRRNAAEQSQREA